MSKSKLQSVIVAGIGLVLIGAMVIYISLSQPKIYVSGSSKSTGDKKFGDFSENLTAVYSSEYAYGKAELPLNLNDCTAQQLMEIEGIGSSRAMAIIEYRDYLGGYSSVEEIKNIKGIGDSLYDKIAPYLYV